MNLNLYRRFFVYTNPSFSFFKPYLCLSLGVAIVHQRLVVTTLAVNSFSVDGRLAHV